METLRFILQKARFCELMAPDMHMDGTELYLFGMIAVLQSTLSLSDADLAETLKLRPQLIAALQGDSNDYWRLLQIFEAHNTGDWTTFSQAAAELGHVEDVVSTRCREAHQWASEIMMVA